MPLTRVAVTFRMSHLPLRVAAIAIGALACGAMSACSPYVFSDEIQTFSNKVKSIDSTYQDSKQKIAAEERLTQRAEWILVKPKLAAGLGCDSNAKSSVRCDIVPQSSGEPARQPARHSPKAKGTIFADLKPTEFRTVFCAVRN